MRQQLATVLFIVIFSLTFVNVAFSSMAPLMEPMVTLIEPPVVLTLRPVSHNIHLNVNIGKYLNDNVFDSIDGIGVLMCAKTCFLRKNCKVIGYNHATRICELGKRPRAIEGGSDDNAVVILKDEIDKVASLTGKCSNHECDEGTTCVALSRQSQPKCIITECGEPPSRANTVSPKFNSSRRTIGAVISYADCIEGKVRHGQPTATCLANGQWSPTNYGCCDCSTAYTVIGDCECLKRTGTKWDYGYAISVCQAKGAQLAVIESAEHLQSLSALEFSDIIRISGTKLDNEWMSGPITMTWIMSVPNHLQDDSLLTAATSDTLAIQKSGNKIKLLSITADQSEEALCQIP